MNSEWMQKMAGKMVRQRLEKLPPEAKAALEKMQVDVVRHSDQIVIAIDVRGDASVEKDRTVMLDAFLVPISQIITLFGCQANVEMAPPQPCGDCI